MKDHKERMAEIEAMVKEAEAHPLEASTTTTTWGEALSYLWRQYKREEKMRTIQRNFLDDVALTLFAKGLEPREAYMKAKAFLEARGEFIK